METQEIEIICITIITVVSFYLGYFLGIKTEKTNNKLKALEDDKATKT